MTGPTVTYAQVPGLDGNGDGDGEDAAATEPPTCLHTVLTSSGNAYMNWQTRIMYATYKKHAAAPGSILEAFTRILHRGKDDELMMEVPTMRFDPNQAKCDLWCDHPVADRSLSLIAQWSRTTDSTRCSHVMMVETDYIYVRSPSPSILLPPGRATAFKYAYISQAERDMRAVYRNTWRNTRGEEDGGEGVQPPAHGKRPDVPERTRPARGGAAVGGIRGAHGDAGGDGRRRMAQGHVRVGRRRARRGGEEHEGELAGVAAHGAASADDALGEAFILHYTWGPEIYDGDDTKCGCSISDSTAVGSTSAGHTS